MSKFSVGDIVRRIGTDNEGAIRGKEYKVSHTDDSTIKLEGLSYGGFSDERFELVGTTNGVVGPFPIMYDNILTPPHMTQYFHTVVLIKKSVATATSAQTEWEELEPYKVRTATSKEDLEKTLLRELDKSIDHNDVKFLISNIF